MSHDTKLQTFVSMKKLAEGRCYFPIQMPVASQSYAPLKDFFEDLKMVHDDDGEQAILEELQRG